MKKQINWSYPTSDNARKANLYNKGCYSVSIIKGNHPPKFLKGFATYQEAKTYADSLPYETDKFCISVYDTHTSKAYQNFLAR